MMVGYYSDSAGFNHGFSYDGTNFSPSIDYGGAQNTYLYGVNNAGTMVGLYIDTANVRHAFTFDGTNFSSPINYDSVSTAFRAINDNGTICGDTLTQGFTYNGVFSPLFKFGSVITAPYGINNFDQLVGLYFTTKPSGFFTSDRVNFEPIEPSPGAGTYAAGINDAGIIVGYYGVHGYMTAVPLPKTLILLGSGLLGLGGWRRLRKG
jgi:hypothetical protein